eukprot:TRINITY_DN2649_c0_g4_i1.p1 TRINITY_DN2649_c0_g4~~TRINITY_DN2649_c0_g4_i1.p1  ORF type:complete len:983 (+),score=200.67 TRINITY_DN2649_c0_g4_i1:76-3024(+)
MATAMMQGMPQAPAGAKSRQELEAAVLKRQASYESLPVAKPAVFVGGPSVAEPIAPQPISQQRPNLLQQSYGAPPQMPAAAPAPRTSLPAAYMAGLQGCPAPVTLPRPAQSQTSVTTTKGPALSRAGSQVKLLERVPPPPGWSTMWDVLPPPPPNPEGQEGCWVWVPDEGDIIAPGGVHLSSAAHEKSPPRADREINRLQPESIQPVAEAIQTALQEPTTTMYPGFTSPVGFTSPSGFVVPASTAPAPTQEYVPAQQTQGLEKERTDQTAHSFGGPPIMTQEPTVQQVQEAQAASMQMDKNGDGVITQAEFVQAQFQEQQQVPAAQESQMEATAQAFPGNFAEVPAFNSQCTQCASNRTVMVSQQGQAINPSQVGVDLVDLATPPPSGPALAHEKASAVPFSGNIEQQYSAPGSVKQTSAAASAVWNPWGSTDGSSEGAGASVGPMGGGGRFRGVVGDIGAFGANDWRSGCTGIPSQGPGPIPQVTPPTSQLPGAFSVGGSSGSQAFPMPQSQRMPQSPSQVVEFMPVPSADLSARSVQPMGMGSMQATMQIHGFGQMEATQQVQGFGQMEATQQVQGFGGAGGELAATQQYAGLNGTAPSAASQLGMEPVLSTSSLSATSQMRLASQPLPGNAPMQNPWASQPVPVPSQPSPTQAQNPWASQPATASPTQAQHQPMQQVPPSPQQPQNPWASQPAPVSPMQPQQPWASQPSQPFEATTPAWADQYYSSPQANQAQVPKTQFHSQPPSQPYASQAGMQVPMTQFASQPNLQPQFGSQGQGLTTGSSGGQQTASLGSSIQASMPPSQQILPSMPGLEETYQVSPNMPPQGMAFPQQQQSPPMASASPGSTGDLLNQTGSAGYFAPLPQQLPGYGAPPKTNIGGGMLLDVTGMGGSSGHLPPPATAFSPDNILGQMNPGGDLDGTQQAILAAANAKNASPMNSKVGTWRADPGLENTAVMRIAERNRRQNHVLLDVTHGGFSDD